MIVQWKLTMTLKDLLTTCVWFSKYVYLQRKNSLRILHKIVFKRIYSFLLTCPMLSYFENWWFFRCYRNAEIAAENEELKHYVQCYDHMFERAHRRLSNLRQEYEESKQYLPPKRYPLVKEMVKTVIRDKKLMPDGFDD